MTEQEVLIIKLQEFIVAPGMMALDGLNIVHKFYVDYQKFVEIEILAVHGVLTSFNKIGPWNTNKMMIERAEWYIQRLMDNPGVNDDVRG